MFWFKNKIIPVDFHGFTDCHSHILPGVDDGVRTLDDSLLILQRYEQMGITEVFLTPHVMQDVPNTSSDLRKRFAEFKKAYSGPIKLHLAAEYMLDPNFEKLLEHDDLLLHGETGRRVLIETSYLNPPSDMEDIIFRLQAAGYEPILAHPERYVYMEDSDYPALKDKGILFQMNLGSLAGIYGSKIKSRALRLLRKGMYDMAGSDIHRPSMTDAFLSIKLDRGLALPGKAVPGA